MAFGVYIHIPYCESKCCYCDFYSRGACHSVPDAYIAAVLREIRRFAAAGELPAPDTVYFGGGTPSLMTGEQVAAILQALCPKAGAEISLEANPDTVTAESLAAYRAAGINRLSFGVQTAHDDSLRRIGRLHSAEQSRTALALAQAAGFTNVSGDIMLALPEYSMAELQDTVHLLADGGCTHISAYMLKIEPGTPFGKHPPQGLPTDDEAADYYLAAVRLLAENGYMQYEISNFAKPGYESRHNLLYWQLEDYIGIGPAAHGCLHGQRFCTPDDTAAFIANDAVYEPLGGVDGEDYMMLHLRLVEGLCLPALRAQYGIDLQKTHGVFLSQLVENGMATLQNDTLALTPRGLLMQNAILCEIL